MNSLEIIYGGMNCGKSALMQKFALEWLKNNPDGKIINVSWADCGGESILSREFYKNFRDLDMEGL